MENKPCCRTCGHKKVFHWTRAERRQCYCNHPNAEEAFKKSGSTSDMRFVAFTAKGTDIPLIKTAPRWCPLRKNNGGGI